MFVQNFGFIPTLNLTFPELYHLGKHHHKHTRLKVHVDRKEKPRVSICRFRFISCKESGTETTDSRISCFEEWSTTQQLYCSKVSLRKYPDGSRGIEAVAPISEGEVLISIPQEAALQVPHVMDPEVTSRAMDNNSIQFDGSTPWYVRLAYELAKQVQKSHESYWHPYINLLPESLPGLSVNQVQVLTALQYTSLLDVYQEFQGLVQRQYQEIQRADPHWVDLDTFQRCVFWVISRSFGIPSKKLTDSDVVVAQPQPERASWVSNSSRISQWLQKAPPEKYAMLPMIDMLNHSSANSQTELVVDYEKRRYEIKSTCEIFPGSQIFVSYGSHANDDLLLFYGFSEELNPHDSFLVSNLMEWAKPMVNIVGRMQTLKGREALQQYFKPFYEIRTDHIDPAILIILRLLLCSEELMEKSLKERNYVKPLSLDNEILVWNGISSKCKEFASQYSAFAKIEFERGDEALNKFLLSKIKIFEATSERLDYFAQMSRKIGRVTTVLVPPSQQILSIQNFLIPDLDIKVQ